MSGLHVPLDVEYASDDKIIEAGPMAELLYVRGLAFCKRTMSDGVITSRQLAVVGIGIPGVQRLARTLVDVGLWISVDGGGWRVVAWPKWNLPAADIQEAKAIASENGIRGNHDRWHVGPDARPSPRCPLCRSARRLNGDRVGDRVPDTDRIGGDIAKGREGKVEPEPEPEGSSSSSRSSTKSSSRVPVAAIEDGLIDLWKSKRQMP